MAHAIGQVLGIGGGGSTGSAQLDANAQAGGAAFTTAFNEQQFFEKQLQQLIANPSSVANLPGFKFQMDMGSQAVARQMAESGFLGSTNEAQGLTQFGQGLASSFYGQQADLLRSLSGITQNPAGYLDASTKSAGASTAQSNNLAGLGLGLLGMNFAGGGGSTGLGAIGGMFTGLFGGGAAAGGASMGLDAILGSSAAGASIAGGATDAALITGGVDALAMFSDRRLKKDVSHVGSTPSGLPTYRFHYIWQNSYEPHYIGCMADEVEDVIPEAVFTIYGFKVIDYSMVS